MTDWRSSLGEKKKRMQ